MQRKVPQFIEIEDKIFGPFTLRQFAYLAGGLGLAVIAWRTLPSYLNIFVIPMCVGFGIALAFAKFNQKPLLDTVRNGVLYIFRRKIFSWKNPSTLESYERKQTRIKETKMQEEKESQKAKEKTFSSTQIQELAERLNRK